MEIELLEDAPMQLKELSLQGNTSLISLKVLSSIQKSVDK